MYAREVVSSSVDMRLRPLEKMRNTLFLLVSSFSIIDTKDQRQFDFPCNGLNLRSVFPWMLEKRQEDNK